MKIDETGKSMQYTKGFIGLFMPRAKRYVKPLLHVNLKGNKFNGNVLKLNKSADIWNLSKTKNLKFSLSLISKYFHYYIQSFEEKKCYFLK